MHCGQIGLIFRPTHADKWNQRFHAIPAILAVAFAILACPLPAVAADDTMIAAEPADTASGFDNVDLLDGGLTGKLCVIVSAPTAPTKTCFPSSPRSGT